jgi:hypothetical protein
MVEWAASRSIYGLGTARWNSLLLLLLFGS